MRMMFVFMCVIAVLGVGECAPLSVRMLDLTYPFDGRAHKYPIFRNFSMEVVRNGTLGDTDVWLQSEEYASSTHAGTHMDAPAHFVPGGATIDQFPLRQLIGAAAVVDISERADADADAELTMEDLVTWEERTGQSLHNTIVFMRSGWGSRYYNKTAYIGTPTDDVTQMRFPGVSPYAALWLAANRRVKGVGVDTLGVDRGTSTEFWAHRFLLREGVFILENVANLQEMPVYGATVYALPMKIAGASGAPTRIVATYPEVMVPL